MIKELPVVFATEADHAILSPTVNKVTLEPAGDYEAVLYVRLHPDKIVVYREPVIGVIIDHDGGHMPITSQDLWRGILHRDDIEEEYQEPYWLEWGKSGISEESGSVILMCLLYRSGKCFGSDQFWPSQEEMFEHIKNNVQMLIDKTVAEKKEMLRRVLLATEKDGKTTH